MVECPECGTLFTLGRRHRIGDVIECPECEASLEVVSLSPPDVDLTLDDDEWSRAEDDDEDTSTDSWECGICGYVHDGKRPPAHCPKCGASGDQFDYMDDEMFDDMFDEDEDELEDELVF